MPDTDDITSNGGAGDDPLLSSDINTSNNKGKGEIVKGMGTDLNNVDNNNEQKKNKKGKRRSRIRPLTTLEKASLATLCYINLLNYMDRFTLSGVLDQVSTHFALTNEEAGLVQTVNTISYMAFAAPFGYFGDRYSRKWGVGLGVGIWAAATLLGSLVGTNFQWFLVTRGLVGLGQASFSTLAPTLISDMTSEKQRSRFLALFYFLLPIGSGFGYIVGAAASDIGGSWAWSLRVTPILCVLALLLVVFVMVDPPRGASEGRSGNEEDKELTTNSNNDHSTCDNNGHGNLEVCTTQPSSNSMGVLKDTLYLLKNKSFMLSTMGYTGVSFVSGAMAWWGPLFLASGFALQERAPGEDSVTQTAVSFQFGIAMMMSGVIGVPIGSFSSQKLRSWSLRADPLICAAGLILSAPSLWAAAVLSVSHTKLTLFLVFLGMLLLNLTWCIVADILLYVVMPTRRSAAQGLQILISFALGAAISPVIVGTLTDYFTESSGFGGGVASKQDEYTGLSKALYLVYTVEVLGGLFFLLTAIFVKKDKVECDRVISMGNGNHNSNGNKPEGDNIEA